MIHCPQRRARESIGILACGDTRYPNSVDFVIAADDQMFKVPSSCYSVAVAV